MQQHAHTRGVDAVDLRSRVTGEDFFHTQRAAAILKHEVLTSYVTIFASKVGSVSPGGRVAYLDGFAGAGRYEDGAPGSPVLLLQRAEAMTYRRLECHFVERDRLNYRSLDTLLRQQENSNALVWHTYQGALDQHLDAILREIEGLPLFAFLDPFGLSVTDDLITRLLVRPRNAHGQPATEVLLNFSLRDLRRNVGHLTTEKDYAGKEAQITRLNQVLGGDWWQHDYVDLLEVTADDEKALGAIINGYQDRLRDQGWFSLYAPVRNNLTSKAIYLLFFMTRSEQGMWFFADRLGRANAAWRLAVEQHDVRRALDRGEGLTLFDEDPQFEQQAQEDVVLRWRQDEALLAERRTGVIMENLQRLLARQREVRLAGNVEELYGKTLTLADETDVRRAVKRLFDAGVTPTRGTGDLVTMTVVSSIYGH